MIIYIFMFEMLHLCILSGIGIWIKGILEIKSNFMIFLFNLDGIHSLDAVVNFYNALTPLLAMTHICIHLHYITNNGK